MKKILITCLAFCLSFNLYAQKKVAEKEITALMQNANAVGIAVAVVKNNKLIYSKSFGKKDLNTNAKLKKNDIFRIASISKSFAATAIMQLVEQNKVSLDDDFGKLIGFPIRNPKYPDDVITLRMVLSHTSSISDKQGYFNLDVINPAKSTDYSKCYANNKPGSTYSYCNLNYNMIGAVVERISGMRYDAYINQNILKPLKLYGGYAIDSLDAKKFASIYTFNKNRYELGDAYNPRRTELASYELGYSTPVLSPTGGMKISAIDLAKYMMMHMNYGKTNNKTIITESSSKTMQTPVNTKSGYGLALTRNSKLVEGKTLIGHTGSAYGLFSTMYFSPEEKFGIVVMTNGIQNKVKGEARDGISEVYRILYKHLIK